MTYHPVTSPVTTRDTGHRTPESAPTGTRKGSDARVHARVREANPETGLTQRDDPRPGAPGTDVDPDHEDTVTGAGEGGDGQRELWLGVLRPPRFLADPPPSVAELTDYARHAPYTGAVGKLRTFGIWWLRLIGLPVTACCRFTEWIAQRPSRSIIAAITYTIAVHTPLGHAVLWWP